MKGLDFFKFLYSDQCLLTTIPYCGSYQKGDKNKRLYACLME